SQSVALAWKNLFTTDSEGPGREGRAPSAFPDNPESHGWRLEGTALCSAEGGLQHWTPGRGLGNVSPGLELGRHFLGQDTAPRPSTPFHPPQGDHPAHPYFPPRTRKERRGGHETLIFAGGGGISRPASPGSRRRK